MAVPVFILYTHLPIQPNVSEDHSKECVNCTACSDDRDIRCEHGDVEPPRDASENVEPSDTPPAVDGLKRGPDEELHNAIRHEVPHVRVDPDVGDVPPELVVQVRARGEGADALQPSEGRTANLIEGLVLEAVVTIPNVDPKDIHGNLGECRNNDEVGEDSRFVEVVRVLVQGQLGAGGTSERGGLK